MNTKLIIAIVLLVILLVGGIFQEIHMEKVFKELDARIEELKVDYGNAHDIILAEDTLEWWDKNKKRLEFILPHTPLQDVDRELKGFIGYIKTGKYDSAYTSLEVSSQLTKGLSEMFDYRARNVF